MNLKTGKNFIKGFEYIINGDIDNAIAEFKKIILEGSDNLEIYILLGSLMRKKGEFEKAIHIHEAVLNMNNINSDLMNYIKYELIKDYQGLKEYEKVLEYLIELSQRDKSHTLIKQIAFAQMYLKKYEEAIGSFVKYKKLSGKNVDDYIVKCYVNKLEELKEKKSSDYYKYLKKALKLYPENRQLILMHIDYLFENGKKTKAVELTKEFMEKSLIKSDKDLDFVKSVFFDYLNIDTFVKAILKKVAAKDSCPLYYLAASDYFFKSDDEEKAGIVLKDYINEFGYKNIVVQKYAELAGEDVLSLIYKDKQPYTCKSCNSDFNEYSGECENCGSLNTIDFA